MLFEKVEKEKIEATNQTVETEINQTKPQSEKPEHPAKNVIGNVANILGTAALLIGGVGAAILGLEAIIGFMGLSYLLTVLILVGSGMIMNFIGSKMITQPWLTQAQ